MNYIIDFFHEVWMLTGEMSTSLIFGFLIAGILSVFINPEFVEKHLGHKGFLSVFKASLFGVPLPICSCGVIPVSASLRKHGASKSATVSFLISTPQTGVDSIMVTYSLMGIVYGVFRPIAALVSGIFGGILVAVFDDHSDDEKVKDIKIESHCSSGSCSTDHGHSHDHDHSHDDHEGNKIVKALKYGFITLPEDISKALILGIMISALISMFIPDNYFADLIGDNNILAMIVMLFIGIPVYVCSTGSVPVAAVLIAKGVSPGAALVFLMTGPATNAATITTIWKIMGRRTVILYLLTIAVSSIFSGLILDYIFNNMDVPAMISEYTMDHGGYKDYAAALLLIIIFYPVFKRFFVKNKVHNIENIHENEVMDIVVTGMTCNHCKMSIEKVLNELPEVEKAQVDLDSGKAEVVGKHLNFDKIEKEIQSLGYEVKKDMKEKIVLTVEGMTCQGCKNTVTLKVKEIECVSDVNVDLENKKVEITGNCFDSKEIIKAIEDAGFKVID